ncbi:restriction endonuclease subunit S [Acinetobacter radioresistens]|jgi:type I restriction enzyme, S subunit|uniref:restriction endonuclease subunit S n=1 Tax=Acinetobacter radioresistens TaxID=40216 RepID=UPI002005EA38|nr:restriction endonuclease subunit S [Acinetobacter radioresistens]MCK4085626.1 restriction endonuclease subunit S [Acinetobacter radioresistens]MCX0329459.1 restriction endonuclease subunit S [Acinetobacter radioresistens]
MTKYQKYAEYKDSGVDALGRIPKEWSVMRGKFLFSEINERSENGDETLLSVSEYYGVKPRGENISEGEYLSRAESLEGYKKCYVNDLVMNIMLAWKRGLGISKYNGIVSPAYSVFRFNNKVSPDFMHYLLRTEEYIKYFKTRSTGIIDSRLRLYPDSFGDIFILLPSIDDQVQITNFLDHETAKIDSLIEKQQKLIELLKEKRQAVISHAVTKGLNPDVPMKDSGVEWLGQVPEHWEVSKFGYISQVVRGGSPRPAGDPTLFNGDYSPWVTVAEITKDDELYLTSTETFLTKKGSEQCRVFKAGTLLLSNSGATLGVPKILCIDANANDGVVGFEQLQIDIEFAYYYLSILTNDLRERVKQGSGQPNLNTDIVKNISIAIPPISEIQSIITEIKGQVGKFVSLIKKAEQQILLMQERRTALISAAVTGKIDVRNWQSPTVAEADTELSA